MNDHDAVLKAIIDDLADDLPRLAYADLCEENGDLARAEFIRVQVGLARTVEGCKCASCARQRGSGQHRNGPCAADRLRIMVGGKMMPARRREDQLAGENVSKDGTAVLPRYYEWARQGGLDPSWLVVPGFSTGNYDRQRSSFRRGFVHLVRCPLAAWLARGKALAAAHPLERVELSDRRPVYGGHESSPAPYWWHSGGGVEDSESCALPDEVFRLLQGGLRSTDEEVEWCDYPTSEAAEDALSAALLLHARR